MPAKPARPSLVGAASGALARVADRDPPPLGCRALHRVADELDSRALCKIRVPGAVRPALQMVRRLVHERRAVTDALSDRPPIGGVRMRRMLRADATQPVEAGVVMRIAVPELVQARIVEAQRSC